VREELAVSLNDVDFDLVERRDISNKNVGFTDSGGSV